MSTALGKNNMKLKNNLPFFAARCMRWQQQLEIKMSGFFFKIEEATPLCFPVMTEAALSHQGRAAPPSAPSVFWCSYPGNNKYQQGLIPHQWKAADSLKK